jgi:hypothetical protein
LYFWRRSVNRKKTKPVEIGEANYAETRDQRQINYHPVQPDEETIQKIDPSQRSNTHELEGEDKRFGSPHSIEMD